MQLQAILNSIKPGLLGQQASEILKDNGKEKNGGLILTGKQAKELLETRNRILQNLGRVELDVQVTKKLIDCFSLSGFISQGEFFQTLNELHELFYYLKNETEDRIGDDELIEIIWDYFENSCGGSLEDLKGKMESFARNVRERTQREDFILNGGAD